jgi:hypothetical protein
MDDHPHATVNAIEQTEQELLISTVSDEALEKAACGTSWGQTYPQTCVATICVGDALFRRSSAAKLPTHDEARRIAANAKLLELVRQTRA